MNFTLMEEKLHTKNRRMPAERVLPDIFSNIEETEEGDIF